MPATSLTSAHVSFAGPELRKGSTLFRVVNCTGLQIREGIALDSKPCGRIYPGDVFCVNRSSTTHSGNKHVIRLHVVQPRGGWVSGIPKWVKKFQECERPGPSPLKSTLNNTCAVLMKKEEACDTRSLTIDRRTAVEKRRAQRAEVEAPGRRAEWLYSR